MHIASKENQALTKGTLKEYLKKVSEKLKLPDNPDTEFVLRALFVEVSNLISVKENTAIAYYSSFMQFLDQGICISDKDKNVVVQKMLANPEYLKKIKTLVFIILPPYFGATLSSTFVNTVKDLYFNQKK